MIGKLIVTIIIGLIIVIIGYQIEQKYKNENTPTWLDIAILFLYVIGLTPIAFAIYYGMIYFIILE